MSPVIPSIPEEPSASEDKAASSTETTVPAIVVEMPSERPRMEAEASDLTDDLTFDAFDRSERTEALLDRGAEMYLAGLPLEAATDTAAKETNEAVRRVEGVVNRRLKVFEKRMTANAVRAEAVQKRLEAAEAAEPEFVQSWRDASRNLGESTSVAIALRLQAAAIVAKREREAAEQQETRRLEVAAESAARESTQQNAAMPPATMAAVTAAATPLPPASDTREIPQLEDTAAEMPANRVDLQIATTWRRIRRMRAEHDAAKQVTAALERNGFSSPMSRFLQWSGYTVLGGAGSAIGALLQESEIGNHMLERFFAAIQVRFGFVDPASRALAPLWPSAWGPLGGLFGATVLLFLILFVLLLTLRMVNWLTEKWSLGEADGEDADGRERPDASGEDAPFGQKRLLKAIMDGEHSIVSVLPGLAIGVIGFCVFLMLAPPFSEKGADDGFSITKSSIGFVIALVSGAFAQILFRITILPIVLDRLRSGHSLALAPVKVWAIYAAVICAFCAVLAFGPAVDRSFSGPVSTQRSVTTESAGKPPEAPKWAAHTVWFVTSSLLLAGCALLACGSAFGACFREESRIRARLHKLEERLAQKLPHTAPPPHPPVSIVVAAPPPPAPGTAGAAPAPAVPAARLGDPLPAGYDTEWLDHGYEDTTAQRLISCLTEEDGTFFESFRKAHAECTVRLREAGAAKTDLENCRKTIRELRDELDSLEKSTRNYENRSLRVQQQADLIVLMLLARLSERIDKLTRGYGTARAAYGDGESGGAGKGLAATA